MTYEKCSWQDKIFLSFSFLFTIRIVSQKSLQISNLGLPKQNKELTWLYREESMITKAQNSRPKKENIKFCFDSKKSWYMKKEV